MTAPALWLAGLLPDAPDQDGRAAWAALYPSCKHVFMTRRNKVRLAVSWWRAIKSGEWHRPGRDAPTVVDPPSGRPERPKLPENLEQFVAMTVSELSGLHEGNIARYRLRLSEFRRWSAQPGYDPATISSRRSSASISLGMQRGSQRERT